MLPVKNFIKNLQRQKDSSAIIIACSGRKRSDSDIISLKTPLTAFDLKQTSIDFDSYATETLISFRNCAEKEHPDVIKPSEDYPAYLRYNGLFYKAVWEHGGANVREKVIQEDWKVIILSATMAF